MNQQPARPPRRRSKRARSGQALVEYALTILIMAGVFMVINNGVRNGIGGLWKYMAKNVAAGCPGCPPPPEFE